MKILVTGGAGYIGSHVCARLFEDGRDVALTIVDDLSNASMAAVESLQKVTGKSIDFVKLNLCDREGVRKLLSRGFDAVIHMAGKKAVGESVSKPQLYYENNIGGTLSLTAACAEFGCKTMVFASSATVYGMVNPVPFTEEQPTSATNPYGWSKVMIERILTDLCTADPDWSIVLLRYFNPIGAHKSGLMGEDPAGVPANIFPMVAKVAAGLLPVVPVFGDDYDTPDGTGVRDYVHVCDLADGHVHALTHAMEHKGVETVNLGTGKGISVKEILTAFSAAIGREVPAQMKPRRPGDIATCYASAAKAERLWGWKAKRTLKEACEDTWHFMNTKK